MTTKAKRNDGGGTPAEGVQIDPTPPEPARIDLNDPHLCGREVVERALRERP